MLTQVPGRRRNSKKSGCAPMTKIKLTAEDYDGLLRAYETTVECLCGDDVLSAEIDKAVFSNDLDLKRRVLERLKV
jgi:hypothetical protein